jgi:uncharacterized Zn finger protein (UPF0148 family)
MTEQELTELKVALRMADPKPGTFHATACTAIGALVEEVEKLKAELEAARDEAPREKRSGGVSYITEEYLQAALDANERVKKTFTDVVPTLAKEIRRLRGVVNKLKGRSAMICPTCGSVMVAPYDGTAVYCPKCRAEALGSVPQPPNNHSLQVEIQALRDRCAELESKLAELDNNICQVQIHGAALSESLETLLEAFKKFCAADGR